MSSNRSIVSLFAMLIVGALAVGSTGCVNLSSCRDVCIRFEECYDDDYDVDECIDSCVEKSRDELQYAEQVDVCAVCIRDRSCNASFECAGECHRIVP